MRKRYLTWNNGGAHLLATPGQGERNQSAIEQRFGQMRVQVSHGRRKSRDVVRQPMIGVFDPAVHVADPIVSLILEVQTVRVVHQPRSVWVRKHSSLLNYTQATIILCLYNDISVCVIFFHSFTVKMGVISNINT